MGFPNRCSLDSGQTNENGRGRLPPTLAPAILFNHEWTRITPGPSRADFVGLVVFSRLTPSATNGDSSGAGIAPEGPTLVARGANPENRDSKTQSPRMGPAYCHGVNHRRPLSFLSSPLLNAELIQIVYQFFAPLEAPSLIPAVVNRFEHLSIPLEHLPILARNSYHPRETVRPDDRTN